MPRLSAEKPARRAYVDNAVDVVNVRWTSTGSAQVLDSLIGLLFADLVPEVLRRSTTSWTASPLVNGSHDPVDTKTLFGTAHT